MQTTFRCLRMPVPTPRPVVILSVKPLADAWLVREAESSSGEIYERKEDALARARHILRRRGGGRLRILKRDGFVERELEMLVTSTSR